MTEDELELELPHIRLYQKAKVNFNPTGQPSIHEGIITLISKRGINIKTMCGDRFVKWDNVIEIIK
jgi:hypothetical protein